LWLIVPPYSYATGLGA